MEDIVKENDESMVLQVVSKKTNRNQQSSDNKWMYCRSSSDEQQQLKQKIINSYKKKFVTITSSGLSAISILLEVILSNNKKEKINLIYSDELYSGSTTLFHYLANEHDNVSIIKIDITKTNDVIDLFSNILKGQNNILFIESSSNPNSYVMDFKIIEELRKFSKIFYSIVDNTWLTEIIFNPFNYDVDFVVMSLTKYYSAGHAIGGAIVGDNAIMKTVHEYVKTHGFHVSPLNCKIICDNVIDIKKRIVTASDLTLEVIKYLENKIQINHPSLKNHVSHELSKKYFKKNIYPSVFTVKIKKDIKEATKIFINSGLDYKTSFGANMTRIDPWPYIEDGHSVFRISIGYGDSYDRIIKEFDKILLQLNLQNIPNQITDKQENQIIEIN